MLRASIGASRALWRPPCAAPLVTSGLQGPSAMKSPASLGGQRVAQLWPLISHGLQLPHSKQFVAHMSSKRSKAPKKKGTNKATRGRKNNNNINNNSGSNVYRNQSQNQNHQNHNQIRGPSANRSKASPGSENRQFNSNQNQNQTLNQNGNQNHYNRQQQIQNSKLAAINAMRAVSEPRVVTVTRADANTSEGDDSSHNLGKASADVQETEKPVVGASRKNRGREAIMQLWNDAIETAERDRLALRSVTTRERNLKSRLSRIEEELEFLRVRQSNKGPIDNSTDVRNIDRLREIAIKRMLSLTIKEFDQISNSLEMIVKQVANAREDLHSSSTVLKYFGASAQSRTVQGKKRAAVSSSWMLGKVDPRELEQLQSFRFERPYEPYVLTERGFLEGLKERSAAFQGLFGVWQNCIRVPSQSVREIPPLVNVTGGAGVGISRFLQTMTAPDEPIPQERNLVPAHMQKPLADGQHKWEELQALANQGLQNDRFVSIFRHAVGINIAFSGRMSRLYDDEAAPEDALVARLLYSYFGQGASFSEFLSQVHLENLPHLSYALRMIQNDAMSRKSTTFGFGKTRPAIILAIDNLWEGAHRNPQELELIIYALMEAAEEVDTFFVGVSCTNHKALEQAQANVGAWASAKIALEPLSLRAVDEAAKTYHQVKSWQAPRWMHDEGAMEALVACGGNPKLINIVGPSLKPGLGNVTGQIQGLMTNKNLQYELEANPLYDVLNPEVHQAYAAALSSGVSSMDPERVDKYLVAGLLYGSDQHPYLPALVPHLWMQLIGLREPPRGFRQMLAAYERVIEPMSSRHAMASPWPVTEELMNLYQHRMFAAFIMRFSALGIWTQRQQQELCLTDLMLRFGSESNAMPDLPHLTSTMNRPIDLGANGFTIVEDFDIPPENSNWKPKPMHVYVPKRGLSDILPVDALFSFPLRPSLTLATHESGVSSTGLGAADDTCIVLGVRFSFDEPDSAEIARRAYEVLNLKSALTKLAAQDRFALCILHANVLEDDSKVNLTNIYKEHDEGTKMTESQSGGNIYHSFARRTLLPEVWRQPSAVLDMLRNTVCLSGLNLLQLYPDTIWGQSHDSMQRDTALFYEIGNSLNLSPRLYGEAFYHSRRSFDHRADIFADRMARETQFRNAILSQTDEDLRPDASGPRKIVIPRQPRPPPP